eukprot:scaffold140378_cov32-Tisochrysis_lutea.AAC.2
MSHSLLLHPMSQKTPFMYHAAFMREGFGQVLNICRAFFFTVRRRYRSHNMAVMMPAPTVFPASRRMTRPIDRQSLYNSMGTTRCISSTTIAVAPGARARGRGPVDLPPCLSTLQMSLITTAGTLLAWQYSSQGIPRVTSVAKGKTRSWTSIVLARRAGRKPSQRTHPAASAFGSTSDCESPAST